MQERDGKLYVKDFQNHRGSQTDLTNRLRFWASFDSNKDEPVELRIVLPTATDDYVATLNLKEWRGIVAWVESRYALSEAAD